MDRHSEYKDSGMEWIGEIPRHWELIPTKYVSKIMTGSTPKSSEKEFWGGTINWYTPLDFGKKRNSKFLNSSAKKITYAGLRNIGDSLIEANSLVLSTRAPVGYVGISTTEFATNQGCKSLVTNHKSDVNYLYYYFSVNTMALNAVSSGTTFTELTKTCLSSFIALVPPRIEQKIIGEYLDQKTSQIDSLIEKLERKIELLKEYRTALISQCVTKGLDPDVDMKDSGIEWIGEIPRHWSINRLANFCTFSKGKSISKRELMSNGFPCILYSEIYTKYERVFVSVSSYVRESKALGAVKVQRGAFLFTCSGETKEDIGKCVLYLGSEEIAVGGDCVIAKLSIPSNYSLKYLSYVFNANYVNFCKELNSRGDIIVHIYTRQIREIRVALPPEREQVHIAQFLDKKTSQIDSLIEKLQQKIELHKEYRQALISNIVTGKVRVLELAK